MKFHLFGLVPLLAFALVSSIAAQTSVNPDISAIGDFRAFYHDDASRQDEAEAFNFADPQFELNINGHLNPYVRADIVLGWHEGHNAEVEEVYATVLRGLPLNTNLRVGKYLMEFGRLNPVHPHAYSFINRPLVHRELLGEEGFSDMTARASVLLPTGNAYTELMAAVLKGDVLMGHEHSEEGHEQEDEEEEEGTPDLGFFGRLTTSFAVSDNAELALGTSVANAVYAFVHEDEAAKAAAQEEEEPAHLRAWLLGGDIKYKYAPSRYTTVQAEAEAIVRREEQHDGDDINSYGFYGYIDYRFNQQYNVGGIVDWLRQRHVHEEDGHEIHETDTWRGGLFVGFAPIEETSLVRLTGFYTDPNDGDGFFEVTMQLVVSLGPHKPHNF